MGRARELGLTVLLELDADEDDEAVEVADEDAELSTGATALHSPYSS
jgi:hypothetical protein